MESRSGRLRGSNKKDRGQPLFFLPAAFDSVIESCAVSANRKLCTVYRISIATEKRLLPVAACR